MIEWHLQILPFSRLQSQSWASNIVPLIIHQAPHYSSLQISSSHGQKCSSKSTESCGWMRLFTEHCMRKIWIFSGIPQGSDIMVFIPRCWLLDLCLSYRPSLFLISLSENDLPFLIVKARSPPFSGAWIDDNMRYNGLSFGTQLSHLSLRFLLPTHGLSSS